MNGLIVVGCVAVAVAGFMGIWWLLNRIERVFGKVPACCAAVAIIVADLACWGLFHD